MRVLILGGSGVFGSRLARILDRDARFDIVIAGRDRRRAESAVAALGGPARKSIEIFSLDEIAAALARLRPGLVVHCAGPFQGQDYRVAEAAIAARIPYVDLADGRAFAEGFSALDGAAKKAGVSALTACSTTSALSTAAAKRLAADLSRIDGVRVGVTPGNRAPRGRAVIEAILGYAGAPIPVWRDGAPATVTGWGKLEMVRLPGLGRRLFSPCDAPDLPAMRLLFPSAKRIDFLAGLELSVLHIPLFALAMLRRWRILPNLAAAAPLFQAIAQWLEPFGTDKGGMFVELCGRNLAGAPARRRWSLYAGSGDGPFIPAMAAAIIAKRIASGAAPAPGARMTAGEITLDDFAREFAAFDITTEMEASDDADALSRSLWRAV
ncbi:MAG: saccharopine dehydrogenase NADP-binding domain-containing protein [Parvularculaceae bacterium]